MDGYCAQKLKEQSLIDFSTPYYADKDIMHNMWHIDLVKKMVDKIILAGQYKANREILLLATYFHGFIYKDEERIRIWMTEQGYSNDFIQKTIRVAWESQRRELPESIEGKILHDAHVLEGGKTYLVVKTLITGSVRGQTLMETIKYMKDNVLDKNSCCLPETIPLCEEMNRFTNEFYNALINDIL